MKIKTLSEGIAEDIGHAFGYYDYGTEHGLIDAFPGRDAVASFICGYVKMAFQSGMLLQKRFSPCIGLCGSYSAGCRSVWRWRTYLSEQNTRKGDRHKVSKGSQFWYDGLFRTCRSDYRNTSDHDHRSFIIACVDGHRRLSELCFGFADLPLIQKRDFLRSKIAPANDRKTKLYQFFEKARTGKQPIRACAKQDQREQCLLSRRGR